MSINFKSKAKVLALKAGGGGGAPVLKAKKAGAKPRAPAPPPPVVDAATAEGLADLDDAGGTPARAPRGMEDIGGLATAHAAPAAQKAPRENALPKVTPPRPPERAGGSKCVCSPSSAPPAHIHKRMPPTSILELSHAPLALSHIPAHASTHSQEATRPRVCRAAQQVEEEQSLQDRVGGGGRGARIR